MTGTRRPDRTAISRLKPGDYCIRPGDIKDGVRKALLICDPVGNKRVLEEGSRWQWIEYPEGEITVREAIRTEGEKPWLGYLERGQWRALN